MFSDNNLTLTSGRGCVVVKSPCVSHLNETFSLRIKSTQTYAKFLEDREKLSVDRDLDLGIYIAALQLEEHSSGIF